MSNRKFVVSPLAGALALAVVTPALADPAGADRPTDIDKIEVHGEYVEVDKPRRLVFTWLASWDNFAETLIVLELTPTAKGTHVKIRHSGFGERRESGLGHAQGWIRVLGWLSEHPALR